MRVNGTATGIKETPESDGSHLLQVTSEKGDLIDVRFTPDQVRDFVTTLQQGMLNYWTEMRGNLHFPILTVLGCRAGNGHTGPELLVSTDLAGSLTLSASEATFRDMKTKIDRVLEMNAEKKKSN